MADIQSSDSERGRRTAEMMVLDWDTAEHGELAMDSILAMHQPVERYRVSPANHPPETRFQGTQRAGRVYVLLGSCEFRFGSVTACLVQGQFLNFPAGGYEFTARGNGACKTVRVWELPPEFWNVTTDNQTCHPAITITRYVVGVGSMVGFAWATWFLLQIQERGLPWVSILTRDATTTAFILGGPSGYVLLAHFCLRRWHFVQEHEGRTTCFVVLLSTLCIGVFGTVVNLGTLQYRSRELVSVAVFSFGCWVLCSLALASGIRKLRRMRQEANAE